MLTIKDNCNIHVEQPDTEKPTIRLNGDSNITIKVNEKFTDPGATATDNKDGDISSRIVTTGNVVTSKAGVYKITYTVEDTAKNVATVTRTVIVKAEAVVPQEPEQPEEPNVNDQNNIGGSNTGGNTINQNTEVTNTIATE